MDEYRLFWLTPGQQAPDGSTGHMLSNGGIVWTGVSGTFPDEAILGTILDTDMEPDTTYDNRAATQDEIDEYNTPPSGGPFI